MAPRVLIRAGDRAALPEQSFSHPLNPNSEIHGHSVGELAGLKKIGVHIARIPPGKESFVRHVHYVEEEFVYILSGSGIAEIDGEEHEVGPGDFLGYVPGTVSHHLRNPFDEDLVYLSAGERSAVEVADFPTLGKRMVRVGTQVSVYPMDHEESLAALPRVRPSRE